MVKQVECLGAELQFQTLVDWKLPTNRQIHLPGSEAAQEVPGSIADLAGCGKGKGTWIDSPVPRAPLSVVIQSSALRATDVHRVSRNYVQAPEELLSGGQVSKQTPLRKHWETAPGGKAVVDAPMVYYRAGKAVLEGVR